MSTYTIDEHRHRFAVWAAGRAYSRGGTGGGYTVEAAKLMLEAAGSRDICSVEDLPAANQIDAFLSRLIGDVRAAAPQSYTHTISKKELPFICTYGRAQKLVNIYLKSKLICASANHDDERLAKLHPPLDSKLLAALDSLGPDGLDKPSYDSFRRLWAIAQAKCKSWTDFDKATYDAYIAAIKALQGTRPLWAVEEHWMNDG